MSPLEPLIGTECTRRITIDVPRTIGLEGEDLRVYATSAMVRDIELACRDVIRETLLADQNSVGARMEIDHLGAALLDSSVEITVRVTGLDRRRVEFEAEVRDSLEVIGKAKHVRYVVELTRQRERLRAKAERLRDSQKS